MAIDTGAYYYLFDPAFQIENNNGKPVVGGHVEVYEAGTDNKVITCQDWDGTVNPFKIPLKSDGRAVILVDIGRRYDAYAYDSFGNLVFSRLNILPLTSGNVSVKGLSKVFHDSTLSGDGTATSPLKVIGGGGGGMSTVITQWPVTGNGSTADPVTIKDITLLANDDTLTSYTATVEGKESLVIGVNSEWFDSATTGFQTKAGMSNYVTNNTLIANVNSINRAISNEATARSNADTALSNRINEKYDTSAFNNTITAYATKDFVTGITDNKLDTSAFDTTITAYALKTDIPVVPTNVGAFTNDVGYLTAHQSLAGYMEESKLEYNSDNQISGYNGSAFAGGNDTFVAIYGSTDSTHNTTFAEVVEAYNAGKAIIAKAALDWNDSYYYAGREYVLTLVSFSNGTPSNFSFSTIAHGNGNDVRSQRICLNSTGWYIAGTFYAADETYVNSAVSGKLDTTAFSSVSGDFALKTEIPSIVGLMSESNLEYNSDNQISGYNGSAFAAGGNYEEFVATFGVTTRGEIEEAYNAGKHIKLIDPEKPGVQYTLNEVQEQWGTNAFLFNHIFQEHTAGYPKYGCIRCWCGDWDSTATQWNRNWCGSIDLSKINNIDNKLDSSAITAYATNDYVSGNYALKTDIPSVPVIGTIEV